MAAHAVLLHPGNYVPFHFVGELFTDPEFWGRLRGRRVAVCAGFEGREVESVLGGLRELGTGETDFVKISSTRAMLERGVLTRVPAGVSLVFVAAGIGAANVLVQLQPLRVPVLDVGSLLNTFVDRSYLAHGLFPFPQRQALVGLEPQAPIDAAEAQA
jgi:hypothetical protein